MFGTQIEYLGIFQFLYLVDTNMPGNIVCISKIIFDHGQQRRWKVADGGQKVDSGGRWLPESGRIIVAGSGSWWG